MLVSIRAKGELYGKRSEYTNFYTNKIQKGELNVSPNFTPSEIVISSHEQPQIKEY